MDESLTKGGARLCQRLGLEGTAAADFLAALAAGQSSRQAVVLTARAPQGYVPPFPCVDTSGWSWLPPQVFVPQQADLRTGSFDDYREGLYYPLDLSSCWESAALAELGIPRRSLDLCAAPGGKSMLMLARWQPQEHVANEVNAARRGILRQNMEQCGYDAVRVTGLRPDQWGKSGELFDLLLVDAPCSGQSLLAKGLKNPGCLGSSMVNGNAKRQRGILLSVLPNVAPGGHLLYSTCTYDPEENEKVMAYILRRAEGWQAQELPSLSPFRSALADFPCYRLMPAHGFGAGGFCCLLKKSEESLNSTRC